METKLLILSVSFIALFILIAALNNIFGRIDITKEERITPYDLVQIAARDGESSHLFSFDRDLCIDEVYMNIDFPCKDKEGLMAQHKYCFEKGKIYEFIARRNEKGGVCIEVKEV